jgi:tRNA G18 (ribose-2'-O)-methylase SpoU
LSTQLTFTDDRPDVQAAIATIKDDRTPISFLLDRVESPPNIAMMLRVADAARLEKVYLYQCKLPSLYKLKAARNVLQYLDIVELNTPEELMELAKNNTFIAIEKTSQSVDYHDFKYQKNTILILGNESDGVQPDLLLLAKAAVHLPMLGINTSMNVACAASIVVYEALYKISDTM